MLSADIEIVEKYLVSREYNEAVTPAWLRIKAALEESTNSSHNIAMADIARAFDDGFTAGSMGVVPKDIAWREWQRRQ